MKENFILAAGDNFRLTKLITGAGDDVVDNSSNRGSIDTIITNDGDDKITLFSAVSVIVDAGAGDDLITLGTDIWANSRITLGAGADTLVTGKNYNLNHYAFQVTDYSYADGDVVVDSEGGSGTALDAAGVLKINGTIATIQTKIDSSNSYRAVIKRASTTGAATEYWTAAANVASTTMDLSSVAGTAVLNASGASTSVLNLSHAYNDRVTLSKGADTVVVAENSGTTKTFEGGNPLDSDDTLIVTDGAIGDLKFAGSTLDVGTKTTPTALANAITDGTGKLKVSFDGGTTSGLVQYSSKDQANNALTQDTDTSYYVGVATTTDANKTVLNATASVNLQDTTKYTNISKVAVTAGVTAGSTFVGNAKGATAIDANAADKGVAIWGGSTDADTITLGALASDTVWFGRLDGKGVDAITGFDGGFTTDDDVLYLYDTASLTDVSITAGEAAAALEFTTGTSTVSVASATDQLEIMLADKTTKKVAANFTHASRKITADGADFVMGLAETADATNTAAYTATTDSKVYNLNDATAYVNISNVNLTGSTGAATVIGSVGAKSAITTGAGNAVVWAASTDTNEITLGAGTDVVWYAGATTDKTLNDGQDTVTGFSTANDTIKLWDVSSAAEVASRYSFTAAADTIIKAAAADIESTLTLTAVDSSTSATVKLMDAKNEAIRAAVGTGTLSFAADVQLYEGTATAVKAGSGVTGTVSVYLGNSSTLAAGSYYFADTVTSFDASSSSASYVLIGRTDGAKGGSTLIGGKTSNAYWGGSYASDNIQGSTSAVDTVWFGTTDGSDTFTKGADKGDTVYLYNTASVADVKLNISEGAETLVLGGSYLTITDTGNTALKGGLTFQLSDGRKYVYDETSTGTNHLVKKA